MNDAPMPPGAAEPSAASRDLSARAAVLALRLANFVEEHSSEAAGAGPAVAFLRRWAGAAIEAGPGSGGTGPAGAPGREAPLGQLVERLGLSDVERDLLLLAGLPEEHEALADIFRTMNPGREPYPSVGLAAHAVGQADRPDRPAKAAA